MPSALSNTVYLVLFMALQQPALADSKRNPEIMFINPGHPNESFWQDVDLFMLEAAKQLDISLSIKHAERNHLKMVQYAKDLSQSKTKPDYLLLVNEKKAAASMLDILEGSGIKVFLLLNDLSSAEKHRLQNAYWQEHLLGSLIPDNHYIGYETAKALFITGDTSAEDSVTPSKILLISGDKSTPASRQREAGARDYIKTNTSLNLVQTIYGHWQELRTEQQMHVLLKRYPDLKYVWTANDLMAFGVINAVRENGLTPGKDIYISAVNTSKKVLSQRQKGIVSSLGGGHFSAGGWAMVLLHDHYKGIQIPELSSHKLFQLIQPDSKAIKLLTNKDWHKINFKQQSKVFNRQNSPYTFSME